MRDGGRDRGGKDEKTGKKRCNKLCYASCEPVIKQGRYCSQLTGKVRVEKDKERKNGQ